jgi:hypothetical protein
MLLTIKQHPFVCLRSYQSGESLANALFDVPDTLASSTMPYALPHFRLCSKHIFVLCHH